MLKMLISKNKMISSKKIKMRFLNKTVIKYFYIKFLIIYYFKG